MGGLATTPTTPTTGAAEPADSDRVDYRPGRDVVIVADSGFAATMAMPGTVPGWPRGKRRLSLDRALGGDCDAIGGAVVLIGLSAAPADDVADRLCAWIDRRPATGFVVEAAGDAALDWAWARLGTTRCTILYNPSPLERAISLQSASAGVAARVGEDADDPPAAELARLRDEVARIADALEALTPSSPFDNQWTSQRTMADGASGEAGGVADRRNRYGRQPAIDALGSAEPINGITSLDIRKMIRMRRLRDKYFAPELFSDPAWDMLLDLMAARIDRRSVSVSSLCIAAAVPATTALRWIKTMSEAGILVRRSDPQDGRRVFIGLNDASARAMHGYFADMRSIGSLLPA